MHATLFRRWPAYRRIPREGGAFPVKGYPNQCVLLFFASFSGFNVLYVLEQHYRRAFILILLVSSISIVTEHPIRRIETHLFHLWCSLLTLSMRITK